VALRDSATSEDRNAGRAYRPDGKQRTNDCPFVTYSDGRVSQTGIGKNGHNSATMRRKPMCHNADREFGGRWQSRRVMPQKPRRSSPSAALRPYNTAPAISPGPKPSPANAIGPGCSVDRNGLVSRTVALLNRHR